MRTLYGPLLDRDGMAHKTWHEENPATGAWRTRHRVWATPSQGVRERQASFIGVDIGHSKDWIGQVVHLELDPHERLWAIAHVSDRFDPPDGLDLFFSPALTFDEHDGSDVEITSVGIVTRTAQTGTLPIQILNGDLTYRGATKRWSGTELDSSKRPMLERACATYVLERGQPLVVRHAARDQHTGPTPGGRDAAAERIIAMTMHNDDLIERLGPPGPLRIRPCGPILSVR